MSMSARTRNAKEASAQEVVGKKSKKLETKQGRWKANAWWEPLKNEGLPLKKSYRNKTWN